jgi:hypothetical protein
MKKLKFFNVGITILACCLLLLGACKKVTVPDETAPAVFHPFGAGKGQVTVYIATDLGLGVINCAIDGQNVGTISHYSATTACGSGDVNVILSAGSHTFSGSSQSGAVTWNFTFTITEDQCLPRSLTYSGGGGGGSTGTAVFYLNQNSPGGTVTVNCGGQTKYITTYFAGAPGCNNANAANFTLPVGTYNYTAQSNTQNWSGTVTVPANTCSQNLLNISSTSNIGHLTVWSNNTAVSTITVTCGGLTKYITTKYSSQPSCEASGCAIFDVPYGTYSINASAPGGYTWSPYTMTINSPTQCYILKLQ